MTERDDDLLECATCGEGFDPADLGQVAFHEHAGITEEVDFANVPRGERLDVAVEDPGRRVYVAGPLTEDPESNLLFAMGAATRLLDQGFAPYLPHLIWRWHEVHPRDYETWMRLDRAWLQVSEAVLFLGHSPGTDREVAEARLLGIPVLYSVEAVVAWRDASEFGSGRR